MVILSLQVRDMIEEACRVWLRDYNCDGLRFDSANDLPAEAVQVMTSVCDK
jgi:1,4-alpha-glucan branching enzyme